MCGLPGDGGGGVHLRYGQKERGGADRWAPLVGARERKGGARRDSFG